MKKINYLLILILVLIYFKSPEAHAEADLKWSEFRIFLGNNTYDKDLTALDNLTAVDNIEKLKSFAGLGLEIDAKYKSWLKVGTRLKFIGNSNYPTGVSSSNTSYLQLTQYSAGVVARLPVVDTNNVSLDVLAELGLANTDFDIHTVGAGIGKFSKSAGFLQRAGVTLGLGGESVKFYAEGGYEFNKLDDLKFEGALVNGSSLTSVDLSGTYVLFGLIISGIPDWIKPGKLFTVGK